MFQDRHYAKWVFAQLAVFLLAPLGLSASSLFLGFNGSTPVQTYDLSGGYMHDIGPAGALATFPDSTLNSYISVTPDASLVSSTISVSDPSFAATRTFGIQNVITDGGTYGNTLLFSAYDGTVYEATSSGAVSQSWSTGFSHIGVTSNGSQVFTTEGDGGNSIDVWSATGQHLSQIATPYNGLYGLGWDQSTGNFWAGSTNFVYELASDGSTIASFNIPGDSRTPNGAIHDGLEIGNLLSPPSPVITPEPASIMLFWGGILVLALYRIPRTPLRLSRLALCCFCALGTSFGSVNVRLTTSVPSGAPVGTTVNMIASASDTTNSKAFFVYQFNVGPVGRPLEVKRNFYTFNSFPWTPTEAEGAYNLQVVVHSSTGAVGYASGVFSVTSRVTGSAPVITRIAHPLVALYSMPACPAGDTARVRFKMTSDSIWQATSVKTCTGSTSLNFYVAGMRASTTYEIQQDVFRGPFSTVGPLLTFRTGAVPNNLPISNYALVKRPSAPNSSAYPVLLNGPTGSIPFATDSTGALIWYLPPQAVVINYLTRPIPGGTFFAGTSDGSSVKDNRLFREYDLAGNLVRETNYATTADYLARHGADPITSMHHDAILLPNGYIALICSVEKVVDQGDGPTDVIGDQVVVVDSNFQVKWWWNEFDHLDILRKAVLDEKCTGSAGCPHIYNPNYKAANDWTHSNALAYSKADGDLLISSRHQDWVMKFRYGNGAGDGRLLWRLGEGGDFRVNASTAYPWFSHQHNIEFEPDGNLSLFDNGNTRVQAHGGNSRGQAWNLNESSMVANLVTNIDLGAFSAATGSAQLLSNGNYTFDLGFVGQTSQTKEYGPSNILQMQQNLAQNSYRSFRMRSLYQEY